VQTDLELPAPVIAVSGIVCVALDDDDPDLIVVTVFVVKNKGK